MTVDDDRTVCESAAALVIGNELLSGKIDDRNVGALARTLRALGVELRRVLMVPDERATIAMAVRDLAAKHDVMFTSGGVGPTHDDVTIDAVAAAFGDGVVPSPTFEALIRHHYGSDASAAQLRMARVPEGSRLESTEEIRWPTVVHRNVWVLPGVPEVFRAKLAVVRARLRGPRPFHGRAAFLQLREEALADLMERVVAAHPDIEVGSYPKWFDETYRTKVTVDGRARADVERAFQAFLDGLPAGEPQRVE